jgi:outer membrane protein assembly factor BamB
MRGTLTRLAIAAAFGAILSACHGYAPTSASRSSLGSTPVNTQATAVNATSHPVSWWTWGFDRQRTGYNPYETALSVTTVPNLVEKWSFALKTPHADTQPIVLPGIQVGGHSVQVVYVGDEIGNLYAIRAGTGSQLWTKKLGRIAKATGCGSWSDGITSDPVYDSSNGTLYVIDGAGTMWGVNPATGAESPSFPPVQVFTDPTEYHTWSGLLLSSDDSTIYYPTSSHCDAGIYYGTINAINLTTQAVSTFNLVTDPSQYYGDGVWSWGGETIDPSNGNLYAGVGNSQGSLGEAGPNSDSVIELTGSLSYVADEQPETTNLKGDHDIATTPVVYTDQGNCIAFERKDGNFFSVDRDSLANDTYASKLSLGGKLATPAYDPITHALYVNVPNGLTKLNVGPACTLTIAWEVPIGTTSVAFAVPVVANGVVYAAGTDVLYAIDASTGSILWNSGGTISGIIAAAPTIVNGRLYVAAWDGHVYAFGLP